MKSITKNTRIRRIKRVRSKTFGFSAKPRLSVFRSNKQIYAQLIDDQKGITLVSAASKSVKGKNKTETSFAIGLDLAKKALEKKIKQVVFDRGAYKYHGRVKSLAEGARKGGLEF
ncbi:50S ribosomal protein L18 [Candidatus Microgenomates bacterium]|nr:50S ribosomal protein L18 [Candidatus Microgenomates bacterium]